jgi:hypothetical protein
MAEYETNYEIHASPEHIAKRYGYELATHAETSERDWDETFEAEAKSRFEALYPGVRWRSVREMVVSTWRQAKLDRDAEDTQPMTSATPLIDLEAAARTGNVTSEEVRADFGASKDED